MDLRPSYIPLSHYTPRWYDPPFPPSHFPEHEAHIPYLERLP
ncbi:hypothetical protein EVA_02597 [gut metagenome]|uniref:Uncharacterized protein n=1 Tax=gut metagenome TaxID=749906 RepID=J9GMP1_9ZZZZ